MFQFPRKLEKFYTHTPHIAEFWNTISNLPFIIIGLLRLYEGTNLVTFYSLYTLAGVCSGIHHASPYHWTIIIDWMPITLSILMTLKCGIIYYLTLVDIFKLFIAFSALISDHVWTPVPVPWGHVYWHLLASFAIDDVYQTVENSL